MIEAVIVALSELFCVVTLCITMYKVVNMIEMEELALIESKKNMSNEKEGEG